MYEPQVPRWTNESTVPQQVVWLNVILEHPQPHQDFHCYIHIKNLHQADLSPSRSPSPGRRWTSGSKRRPNFFSSIAKSGTGAQKNWVIYKAVVRVPNPLVHGSEDLSNKSLDFEASFCKYICGCIFNLQRKLTYFRHSSLHVTSLGFLLIL